jgi:hypothetical protein
MDACIACGEVIVFDDDHWGWITIEGTSFCVLSRAGGRHVPAAGQRVVDLREPEANELPHQPRSSD